MILKKKNKHRESSSEQSSAPSWLTTGREAIRNKARDVKTASERSFVPTLRISDGETRKLRFLCDEPVAQIDQYTVQLPPKNGRKIFESFTAPGLGQPDAAADAGLRASSKFIYVVVDRTGYLDKKSGKRVRNQELYLVAGYRQYEALSSIAKAKGGLTSYDISLSRAGTQAKTTYQFVPLDRSAPPIIDPAHKKNLRLPKVIEKYFAPPPQSVVEGMLRRSVTDEEES